MRHTHLLCALAVLASTTAARAQDDAPRATTSIDPPHAWLYAPPHAWLYADDARLPATGHVLAVSRVTTTDGGDASRPFAADLAKPGSVLESGAEVGLGSHLSLTLTGFGDGVYGWTGTASGASAALRFAPFGDGPTRVVASFGGSRDLAGRAVVFSRAAFAADVGRFRFASTLLGEHVFDPSRDALDLLVTAGVAYALPNAMRLGVEWVAQDVEGALDPTEKEGVRHFVGPTVGWTSASAPSASAFSVTAGPALGLSYGSPRAVGRLAVVYAF
jgi:hypothetical protein